MHCPRCHRENSADALFCEQCGAKLELSCGACGATVNPDARFCRKCGNPVCERSASGSLTREEAKSRDEVTPERRHLTVLMCGLVGPTASAAQLESEKWREAVALCKKVAAHTITSFGGYIAHYEGDYVMGVFGYPEARDSDVERAVRAALALLFALDEMNQFDELNQGSEHVKLSARIGIDSGPAAVGSGTGQEAEFFGDTVLIAARVQASAAPGMVAISEATRRLVAGLYMVEELEPLTFENIDQPVPLYRVANPTDAAPASRRQEGFWYSRTSPDLPKPESRDTPWDGQTKFLKKLTLAQREAMQIGYRGWSSCRICGMQGNGSVTFRLKDWEWPEGFQHYIQEHNVKPSRDFIEFIDLGWPLSRDSHSASTNPISETTSVSVPLIAERRHLTVLLCDLVGSTALAARLDPEEWRETVARYQRVAAKAITQFGGYVARYVGDGVLAFFGYPEAHDNDAERAVHAGFALLEALAELNQQPGHAKLMARVGIDSGEVVVGGGTGHDVDVFGNAPNIAARVQAAAAPSTVAITDSTQRLVAGLFVVVELGERVLKGIERPVKLYWVRRPSGMRGRFEVAAAASRLTSFVGREDELRSLHSRWERVLEGEGQVALISGEAGIGKSRLVRRFQEAIADTPHTWLQAGASAFFQNTPFYPISAMLGQLISDTPDPLTRLAAMLTAVGLAPTEAVPLIAPLLNLLLPPEYRPSTLAREQQRTRLLATLVEWLLGSARTQPLVSVIEDLHWVDPSTLEVIQLLVEQGLPARLLLIYTARPEFRAPWPLRAHHVQLTLSRLSARNARAMVGEVAAQKALSEETIATVVKRTGGVPLFVEELTRAVLESGDAKLPGSAIPATLHDSLMARLDRLGTAKEVIQVGAVLGSDFSYDLLHAVHPMAEADLQRALRSLSDAELLYVRGIAPEATYQFKHVLIRDAAYEALLKSRRKELHLIVARTIDEKFPIIKETQPEVLARHWTEAGEIEPAITEWQRAAEHAVERRAYREAEQHYRDAISLLQTRPESGVRDTRELKLQVAFGRVMQWTRGWSAAETVEAYTRARVVAERSGGADSISVLAGLCSGANLRGEPRVALALAEQMLAIARGVGQPAPLGTALSAIGYIRYLLGDLAEARQHLREAVEHYSADSRSPRLSGDPLVFSALNEWHLGHPDHALRYMDDALSRARRANDPVAVGFALWFTSNIHGYRGEFDHLRETNNEAIKIGATSGFALLSAIAKILGAWTSARMGEADGALGQIREGLAELNAIKFYATRPKYLCYLAEAQALAGEVDDALATVEEALKTNPDELIHRPSVFRLRGELRLRSAIGSKARLELAEQDFCEAIALARRMEAKSLELRATTSLSGLLAKQSRRDEARAMLAEIYNWFTEGFDTADLQDAKALLDELSS
jgi:class 3 adenylate cyclase/tetratricopeptide (TPR) repeat protein